MMPFSHPAINALLNGTSALFLTCGYIFIKKKKITLHKVCMGLAFVCSGLFLVSYLYYHYSVGSVSFQGEGWIRPVYFFILISHTILATAIVPLVLITLYAALKGQFNKHKRVARWTWPIWMYVSLTGVLVYWMLYQL